MKSNANLYSIQKTLSRSDNVNASMHSLNEMTGLTATNKIVGTTQIAKNEEQDWV